MNKKRTVFAIQRGKCKFKIRKRRYGTGNVLRWEQQTPRLHMTKFYHRLTEMTFFSIVASFNRWRYTFKKSSIFEVNLKLKNVSFKPTRCEFSFSEMSNSYFSNLHQFFLNFIFATIVSDKMGWITVSSFHEVKLSLIRSYIVDNAQRTRFSLVAKKIP